MSETNENLFDGACKVIPGGVNSPVRAFKSVGGTRRADWEAGFDYPPGVLAQAAVAVRGWISKKKSKGVLVILLIVRATIRQPQFETCTLAENLSVPVNLNCQFSGGRKHEGSDTDRGCRLWFGIFEQVIEYNNRLVDDALRVLRIEIIER